MATDESNVAVETSVHLWAAVRAVELVSPTTDTERRRAREYAKAILAGCLELVRSGDLSPLLLAEALVAAGTFVFMTAVSEGDPTGKAIERLI